MFQVNGSLLSDASLPSIGSRRARFPDFIGTMKALRHPARANRSLMVSVPGPTRTSCIRVRRSAPDEPGGISSGPEHLVSRRSNTRHAHAWARAGSHRFPGDPSPAFALLQDPGRAGKISPWRSCRCCPRSTQTEGLNGYIISRLTQGFSIRCLRFTNGVAAAHARLASG